MKEDLALELYFLRASVSTRKKSSNEGSKKEREKAKVGRLVHTCVCACVSPDK